jgi:type IV pilus assembly protein PilN
MKAAASPVLDLLRQRRRELGIEPLAPTLAQRTGLLQRGALIGLALVGGVAGLLAVLMLQHAVVKARLGQLDQVESQAAVLQAKLKASQQKVTTTTATNRTLVTALTSGRTSSALLAQLQRITPESVQLTSADSVGDALTLKGQAFDPDALVRINALLLQLQGSPLFAREGVRLTKVERQPAAAAETTKPGDAKPAPPAAPGPVGFEIAAAFASPDPSSQLNILRRLGSEGMARRIQLLRQQELMP